MDRGVANRALLVSHLCLVMQARRLWRKFFGNARVALETKLPDRCSFQHLGVARTVRYVTSRAALELCRSMLENERALLIRMALYAGYVGTDGQLSLFRFETAVSIVAIGTSHRSLKNFVMKRFRKLGLRFVMAVETELGLTDFQHRGIRLFFDERHRTGLRNWVSLWVSCMTLCAADIISPVLAPSKIIMRLFTFVAGQTGVGDGFSVEIVQVDYLGLIAAAFDVCFTRTVTGLAALYFIFPALQVAELGVFSSRKGLELVLVTGSAGITADIIVAGCGRHVGACDLVCSASTENGIKCSGGKPYDRKDRKCPEQHEF